MVPSKTIQAWFMALMASGSLAAVLHESVAHTPAGWTHVNAADHDQTITLQIGLVEQNLDKLEATLYDISNPKSKNYGNHLEREDMEKMIAPKPEAKEAVVSWLKKNGVTKIGTTSSWVNFQTTVGTANKLLHTQFGNYESNGQMALRTLQYSVPDELQQHIDLVSPTTYFGNLRAQAPTMNIEATLKAKREAEADDKPCSELVTPACLKEAYKVNDYQADPNSGSRIGFGSFLNESAMYSSLELFEKRFNIPSQNFTTVLVNGGVDNQTISENHGEADLDVQYIMGIGNPLPVTQYITGGSPPFIPNIDVPDLNTNEPYLNYYSYLLSQENDDLPQVISNSYGDDEETVPQRYAKRVCNMIGQMGCRGISVLESSGDTGVGAGCKTNDGKNSTVFMAQFPGTCPYVTAVGGTQSWAPFEAWNASSGGFSNYFPRPSYQDAAIGEYLDKHIAPEVQEYYKPYVNLQGRGFPDIAAHSLHPDYAVVYNNKDDLSGGTSAACPTVAAIIALLNDARLREGKKALGFLNPWIYSDGFNGFQDITLGGAVGCNGVNLQSGQPVEGAGIVPYASWNATEAWDPVTGFGIPDFEKLKDMVLELN